MNTLTYHSQDHLTEASSISFLLNHSHETNASIAVWRLPNENNKQVLISHQHRLINKEDLLEELPTGFIFAPFENEKPALFLKADLNFTFENETLKQPITPLESNSWEWLIQNFKITSKKSSTPVPRSDQNEFGNEKAEYLKLVSDGIEKLENGTFEKVVLSRKIQIKLPENFDVVEAFQKLCKAYPNAMVSFVSIPSIGNWIGATPELLVGIKDKTIFRTVALAGTKSFTENLNIKTVAWNQKEIEEQALVERYIISCFKKIRLREYDEHGPKTVIAGNLLHLKSEFTVDMKATNFPQLGSTMLNLLHPTSAVCGVPKESSVDFIKSNEGYDREFYAGYLGPVNVSNNTDLFVNLRCMKIIDNHGVCFAGAGIVNDSEPEDEWNETELKFKTLLNIIL